VEFRLYAPQRLQGSAMKAMKARKKTVAKKLPEKNTQQA